MSIYQNILHSISTKDKLLAVLIDPEKVVIEALPNLFNKINKSIVTHIFVGGSTDKDNQTDTVVENIKKLSNLPVVLFPGSHYQITAKADALLFLSLLSGRNPEYLITQQVNAIPKLQNIDLEIIPTGYILIDGGVETSVQRISKTNPIDKNDAELVLHTALAGQYTGKKIIYLEAGSGAIQPVQTNIIKTVKKQLSIPLIIGGGIRSKKQITEAYKAGADVVVIGTAFEENNHFFNEINM